MSADNWTGCPRCARRHQENIQKLRDKAHTAYGAVPLDEYLALDQAAKAADVAFEKQTFREDYEFYGAEEGTVTASYNGHCGVCGLTCSFEHSVTFDPEPAIARATGAGA